MKLKENKEGKMIKIGLKVIRYKKWFFFGIF